MPFAALVVLACSLGLSCSQPPAPAPPPETRAIPPAVETETSPVERDTTTPRPELTELRPLPLHLIEGIQRDELVEHVATLASPEYEGREVGEPGGVLAGDYIAARFREIGLEPGGDAESYFQEFPIPKAGDGRNVVGIYPGTTRADEAIVVGAHYDHLGFARHRRRLTLGTPGTLHNGADDNASGIAGLIEVAESFVEEDVAVARSVVFIAFDGEEIGLLGSKHYVREPTFPIASTRAMLNFDMISRNQPRTMYIGQVARFDGLNRLVAGVAERFDVTLVSDGMRRFLKRSDHWPFVRRDVPALFLFSGIHDDYHTENDDLERIDPAKMETMARLMFLLVHECANSDGGFE